MSLLLAQALTGPVIGMVEILKACGVPKRFAPVAVLACAALLCGLWALANGPGDWSAALFDYATATIAVTVNALGLHTFATRRRTAPPPGEAP